MHAEAAKNQVRVIERSGEGSVEAVRVTKPITLAGKVAGKVFQVWMVAWNSALSCPWQDMS